MSGVGSLAVSRRAGYLPYRWVEWARDESHFLGLELACLYGNLVFDLRWGRSLST